MAHGQPINCLHIGRKSNGVLVTGGDDKTVKLWAIGNAQALMVGPTARRSAACSTAAGLPGAC